MRVHPPTTPALLKHWGTGSLVAQGASNNVIRHVLCRQRGTAHGGHRGRTGLCRQAFVLLPAQRQGAAAAGTCRPVDSRVASVVRLQGKAAASRGGRHRPGARPDPGCPMRPGQDDGAAAGSKSIIASPGRSNRRRGPDCSCACRTTASNWLPCGWSHTS